jgi:hypothetical protein
MFFKDKQSIYKIVVCCFVKLEKRLFILFKILKLKYFFFLKITNNKQQSFLHC